MKKRKFSGAKSRTELITEFPTSAAALAAATTPPAASEGGSPVDTPAEKDTVACSACEAMNDSKAKFCDQCGQTMALDEGGDDSMADNGVPPQPADGKPPIASPSSNDGAKIDDGVVCGNGDCGHLASSHANVDGGENNGPCTEPGCSCPAMAESADPGTPKTSPPAQTAAGGEVPLPPTPEVQTTDGSEQNPAPAVEGGESMGPAFTIPVVIIEGQPTGDGRQIAPDALTWRTPPIPLMGLATETHDPNGFDMNDPAVICGRIDSFERIPGEGTTQLIQARGYYLPNEDGMYFAELNEAMGRMGVSADVAVQASEVIVGEIDADGWPLDMSEILTEGTIMGATVCPYPAFAGAYIVLGDGTEMPEAQEIPQQAEAPEVPASPPDSVVAGGQLIRFVTYEECAPCDQGLEVVVASGAGPTRPPMAWFSNPNFHPEDGRMFEILDRRGERVLGGKYACPITVEADGRVYGHIAPWGVCHTGSSGQCVLAPHSKVDYAHFKRGQHIVTAEGERIRVGVLTADTGHAPTSGISASAAMAHYDNTAFACADVNVGEDEYGIWVAGAIRPDATEEQIRQLTASSISGDWRQLGGQLELVAALCVNQPGFPLAVVAHGQIESLVAAGGPTMYALKAHEQEEKPEVGDVVLRAALAPMLSQASQLARGRINALRA